MLIFMLLFFGLLYVGLSARPQPGRRRRAGLDLDGSVVEQPASRRHAPKLLAAAAACSEYPASRPGRGARRRHGRRPRQGGRARPRRFPRRRPDGDVDLSATRSPRAHFGQAGDRLCRPPTATTATSSPPPPRKSGSTHWARSRSPGPGGSNLYYKGLLDKLGVTANVYRVGTYKSAVEPFIRNDMSPEAKENYQAFGDALLESWREDVLKARPAAKRRRLYARPAAAPWMRPAATSAKAALAAGLVDKLGDRRTFEARLAEPRRRRRQRDAAATSRIKLKSYIADRVDIEPARPDRRRDGRRDDRRRQGAARDGGAATASPRRSSAACATTG